MNIKPIDPDELKKFEDGAAHVARFLVRFVAAAAPIAQTVGMLAGHPEVAAAATLATKSAEAAENALDNSDAESRN